MSPLNIHLQNVLREAGRGHTVAAAPQCGGVSSVLSVGSTQQVWPGVGDPGDHIQAFMGDCGCTRQGQSPKVRWSDRNTSYETFPLIQKDELKPLRLQRTAGWLM